MGNRVWPPWLQKELGVLKSRPLDMGKNGLVGLHFSSGQVKVVEKPGSRNAGPSFCGKVAKQTDPATPA